MMASKKLTDLFKRFHPEHEDPTDDEILSWSATMIENSLNNLHPVWLREIGEYLHVEDYNEAARKDALESYFKLYDSMTGRN